LPQISDRPRGYRDHTLQNGPEVVVEGDRFDWFERIANGMDLATQDGNGSLLRPMNTSALA
jgi:hypothetical protein